MATLNTINTLDYDTIADGDNLNGNVTALSANDGAMLTETLSTYDKVDNVYNTVEENSAKNWDNGTLRNFSAIAINDDKIEGKSRMSGKMTFSGSDTIDIVKDGNKYKFTQSDIMLSISSYYDYARWSSELGLSKSRVDPINLECAWISMQYGSIALFDSYNYASIDGYKHDGFSKNFFVDYGLQSCISGVCLKYLPYSATTRLITNEDNPELDDAVLLTHTIPTRGSLYINDYYSSLSAQNKPASYSVEAYCGATIVDNGSIGIGNKVFAKNFSIGFKGCSAADYSVCLFNCGNYNDYSVQAIASVSSTTIGNNAIANNKSLCITNSVDSMPDKTSPKNVSAVNCSISIYETTAAKKSLIQNSAVNLLPNSDSSSNREIDNSFVVNCYMYSSEYKKRSLGLGGVPAAYSNKRTYEHSFTWLTDIVKNSNSLALAVKGGGYNSKSRLTDSFALITRHSLGGVVSANNSLLMNCSFYRIGNTDFDPVINVTLDNSLFACRNPQISFNDTEYANFYLKDCIFVPQFLYSNDTHTLLLDSQPEYYVYKNNEGRNLNSITICPQNSHRAKNALKRLGNGNLTIKGGFYDLTSGLDIRIDPIYSNISLGQYVTSARNGCAANILHEAMYVDDFYDSVIYDASAIAELKPHTNDRIKQYYAQAYYNSKVQAAESFVFSNSTISIPYIVYNRNSINISNSDNYCLALFNSTAKIEFSGNANGDIVGITDYGNVHGDDSRLSMWQNKLKYKDFPSVQFESVSEIPSVADMTTNTYYIITG